MGFEQAHRLRLERIQPAGPWRRGPASVLVAGQPLRDRAPVESERTGRLRDRQVPAVMVVADLAEGLIVDHGTLPNSWRSWSSRVRTSSGAGASKAST